MQSYRCLICGHIYDPKAGGGGAQPGTAFEDLPDGWLCPVCLAGKDKFSPYESPLGRLGL